MDFPYIYYSVEGITENKSMQAFSKVKGKLNFNEKYLYFAFRCGTVENTQVSGLGGIQTESTTTSIENGWLGKRHKYRIFRRNPVLADQNEPDANQRASIAQNASKPQILTTAKVKLGKDIAKRETLPPPPKPPKMKNR